MSNPLPGLLPDVLKTGGKHARVTVEDAESGAKFMLEVNDWEIEFKYDYSTVRDPDDTGYPAYRFGRKLRISGDVGVGLEVERDL